MRTLRPSELKEILTERELDVFHASAAGYGRRAGSEALGISEDAWRWRLAQARRKIAQHTREQEEAA